MSYPTLGSFITQVRPKLGNRTDIDDRITQWLMEAYREISMGYDLETLEATVVNSTVYNIDTYSYPTGARAIKSLMLLNGNSPVTPTKKDIRVVRRYQVGILGVPSIWAPFAAQFMLRPTPSQAYPLTIDYWVMPTIVETSATTINATLIKLPQDWFDILTYLAAEKGHQELQEMDKSEQVHQLIFGDPNPSKGRPGMIKERINRNAAENSISNFGIRPRVRPYGSSR